MPRVTIGLPVYNGQSTLQACLENLRSQTYRDFKVVIRDNASTDSTEEIARRFVELDNRFSYIRNAENVGAGQNFLDALDDADTEFFLWRADDDLTDPVWLECMVTQLDQNSRFVLAVSHVESRRPTRGRIKHYQFPARIPGPRLFTIIRQLFFSHASWFYGLWKTKYIQARFHDVCNSYPDIWAQDHLTILGPILDGTVTGDNRSRFIQQIGVRWLDKKTTECYIFENNKNFGDIHKLFLAKYQNDVKSRNWNNIEYLILVAIGAIYANKRI